MSNAVTDEAKVPEPLGKRLRALFRDIGLADDIPEWRGQRAQPADLA